MSVTVEIERSGHIAEVIFANPPNNFANYALLKGVADALETLDADPEVRAIVLRSEGKSFCAGADLVSSEDGLGTIVAEGAPDPLKLFYGQAIRIFSAKKPTVAAVQGAAIGAGLGLAVAADFRVAAPEARFSANFVRLGFHPGFALTHTLPRLVGPQAASLIMLTARRFKADEAKALGLVDQLSTAEKLLADARLLANEIAENAPLALIATRRTMRGTIAADVEKALEVEYAEQGVLKTTADYAEGVASVFERRAARFIGR
jgi:enoyl-CoA hydratase/carnithine racemase